MSQSANTMQQPAAQDDLKLDQNLNARMLRTMALTTGIAVLLSLLVAPWRTTTGVLIGGALAILNHRWLLSSTTAAFSVLIQARQPRLSIMMYVVRYAVVGSTVFAVYQLRLASLTAMFVGLSTFVVAIFVEAAFQMYLSITEREEHN